MAVIQLIDEDALDFLLPVLQKRNRLAMGGVVFSSAPDPFAVPHKRKRCWSNFRDTDAMAGLPIALVKNGWEKG